MSEQQSQQQSQPVFNIEKLYVKDLSVELPGAPQCFLERDPAQIEVQLASTTAMLTEGTHEVTLKVTITAKIGEKTQFLIEVAQAGIFLIQNFSPSDLEQIVAVACPNILFPYAREAVSDCVTRAGFPPVLLVPVNFDALYRQRLASGQAAPQTQQ
jgi:preprotein translocase subunit SecB